MGDLIAYLDTHVVVRIREGTVRKLGAKGRQVMERAEEVRISPAVLLELQILREIGKVTRSPDEYIETLTATFRFSVCEISFADVARAGAALSWTRDPFDRLIVAQAIVGNGALVTADGHIRRFFSHAVWD